MFRKVSLLQAMAHFFDMMGSVLSQKQPIETFPSFLGNTIWSLDPDLW